MLSPKRAQEEADYQAAWKVAEKQELAESLLDFDMALALKLSYENEAATAIDDEAIVALENLELLGARMTLGERNCNLLVRAGRKVGMLNNCVICLNEFDNDNFAILECLHGFCQECMKKTILMNMDNGSVDITCPNVDTNHGRCEHQLTHEEIELFLNDSALFEKYRKIQLNQTLDKASDCAWCPRPGCENAMIGDANSAMSTCPECQLQFCFSCKTPDWHEGSTCENFRRWKKENGSADIKYAEWKQKNSKDCPKCKVPIEKNGGCNHMHCTHCGTHFYWNTLKIR